MLSVVRHGGVGIWEVGIGKRGLGFLRRWGGGVAGHDRDGHVTWEEMGVWELINQDVNSLFTIQHSLDSGKDFGPCAVEGTRHADAGRAGVTAAAEELSQFAAIHRAVLGAEGDADFAVGKFLKEGGDDDTLDAAYEIDEILAVLGFEIELFFDAVGQFPVGDFAATLQLEGIEQ